MPMARPMTIIAVPTITGTGIPNIIHVLSFLIPPKLMFIVANKSSYPTVNDG
jgi:hypothetical protein